MKLLTLFIIGILLVGLAVAVGININDRPDVTKISAAQKQTMLEEYDATGYEIVDCWWNKECYFCELKIGELHLDKRMITCSSDDDRTIWDEECKTIIDNKEEMESCKKVIVGYLTMQELVEKDVIQIVNARTTERDIREDDQRLEGVTKSWNSPSI